jgi:hypothetical protein
MDDSKWYPEPARSHHWFEHGGAAWIAALRLAVIQRVPLPDTGDDHRRVLAVVAFLDTR